MRERRLFLGKEYRLSDLSDAVGRFFSENLTAVLPIGPNERGSAVRILYPPAAARQHALDLEPQARVTVASSAWLRSRIT
jgi:hypothetical protein